MPVLAGGETDKSRPDAERSPAYAIANELNTLSTDGKLYNPMDRQTVSKSQRIKALMNKNPQTAESTEKGKLEAGFVPMDMVIATESRNGTVRLRMKNSDTSIPPLVVYAKKVPIRAANNEVECARILEEQNIPHIKPVVRAEVSPTEVVIGTKEYPNYHPVSALIEPVSSRQDLEEFRFLVRGCLSTLRGVNQAGIIHNDYKLRNVGLSTGTTERPSTHFVPIDFEYAVREKTSVDWRMHTVEAFAFAVELRHSYMGRVTQMLNENTVLNTEEKRQMYALHYTLVTKELESALKADVEKYMQETGQTFSPKDRDGFKSFVTNKEYMKPQRNGLVSNKDLFDPVYIEGMENKTSEDQIIKYWERIFPSE